MLHQVPSEEANVVGNKWKLDHVGRIPPERVPKEAMKCSPEGTRHLIPFQGRDEPSMGGCRSASAQKQGTSQVSRVYVGAAWY